MLGPNPIQGLIEVVQQIVESSHVAASPTAAAMSLVVVGMNRAATLGEPGGKTFVAARVLREPMHD